MKNIIVILITPFITWSILDYAMKDGHSLLWLICIGLWIIIALAIVLFPLRRRKPASESEQITYDQFLDAMGDVAEDFPNANTFFQQYYEITTSWQWEIRSKIPVDTHHVKYFVGIMHREFWELISITDNHIPLQSEAGAFLCAVRDKCIKLGIDVSDVNFDPPLSPCETPITSECAGLTMGGISSTDDPSKD